MAIVVIPTEVLGFVKTANAKNVWLCWTLFVVYSSGLLAHRQTPKTDRKYIFHWLGVKIVSGDNTNYIHKIAPNHSWNQHKETMGQNSIWDWRKEIGVIFVCFNWCQLDLPTWASTALLLALTTVNLEDL